MDPKSLSAKLAAQGNEVYLVAQTECVRFGPVPEGTEAVPVPVQLPYEFEELLQAYMSVYRLQGGADETHQTVSPAFVVFARWSNEAEYLAIYCLPVYPEHARLKRGTSQTHSAEVIEYNDGGVIFPTEDAALRFFALRAAPAYTPVSLTPNRVVAMITLPETN